MPTLNGLSATCASSHVDIKLPMNHGARNVSLVLSSCVGLGQLVAAAIWAAGRQRHVVRLVDPLGYQATMVLAVVWAALAARLLGMSF